MGQEKNARFYYSAPAPCPYLAGRIERRIFADLSGPEAAHRYDLLSEAGFRRSLGFAYRPACPACDACVPVRIPVDDFHWSRGWRRTLKRNADLTVGWMPVRATEEQFQLFWRYQQSRHGDGEMARMDAQDYRTMVEIGAIDSAIFAARGPDGRLMGACLTDRLGNGFSAVYSFFDPDVPERSLGSFLILRLIEEARRLKLSHLYLGFWIGASAKMAYKTRFQPLEALMRDGWAPLKS